MKRLKKMPTKGQFVAVWVCKDTGKIWCNTFKWIDGLLHSYDEHYDDWDNWGRQSVVGGILAEVKITYLVKD